MFCDDCTIPRLWFASGAGITNIWWCPLKGSRAEMSRAIALLATNRSSKTKVYFLNIKIQTVVKTCLLDCYFEYGILVRPSFETSRRPEEIILGT